MTWRGKVISGAQAGVDRAALDAAMEAGLDCGGWVPKGRTAEDGPVASRYPVEECESFDYPVRTELNVQSSDATLILNQGPVAGGTYLTEALCAKHGRPCLVLQLDEHEPGKLARFASDFLARHRPKALNVA